MAELLPKLLSPFNAEPQTVLDLACGEGTFAVSMAKQGLDVTGIDLSSDMLRYAKEQAEKEQVVVRFIALDMRSLTFKEKYDLITCWYDSLNYILELKDLERVFIGVSRALANGGIFIFDMNTVYGLAVNWQRHPCHIQQDTPELLEIFRTSYDYERNIATLRITGLLKGENQWTRMDELHLERGYSLAQIRQCLAKAGFKELACWGNAEEMTDPTPNSGRVWFVAQK